MNHSMIQKGDEPIEHLRSAVVFIVVCLRGKDPSFNGFFNTDAGDSFGEEIRVCLEEPKGSHK